MSAEPDINTQIHSCRSIFTSCSALWKSQVSFSFVYVCYTVNVIWSSKKIYSITISRICKIFCPVLFWVELDIKFAQFSFFCNNEIFVNIGNYGIKPYLVFYRLWCITFIIVLNIFLLIFINNTCCNNKKEMLATVSLGIPASSLNFRYPLKFRSPLNFFLLAIFVLFFCTNDLTLINYCTAN